MKILNKYNTEEFLKDIEYENISVVQEIIEEVKKDGDKAIIKYSKMYDKEPVENTNAFEVSKEEIEEIVNSLDKNLYDAITYTVKSVEKFARAQMKTVHQMELKIGDSILGQKIAPIERILCYAPGGNYPLPSSACMTIIPARVAGVREVILTSPNIKPETIAAAHLAGADRIFRLGGAQAISAFTYGTKTVPTVDKIVGPGNKYVTAAKKYVYGKVDIDFLAGPSEVLIIADETADAKLIAADILAQAEHDKDARAYLISTSRALVDNVREEADKILETLETKEVAEYAYNQSIAIVVDDIREAIQLANRRAPEHVELQFEGAEEYKDKFRNFGTLFIGKYSAEVFGDYCSGTNHVLPTNKVSRYRGGLSVFDFIKIQTYQTIDENYAKELSKYSSILANAEGLMAHKLASDLRGQNGI
ncbi:histidinol dehydrogenase [bacterium]|nr:histidinol dehydrogenase [bacterium]